jgi:flavin reductase (DIM6/NTAB) family NADH-FMN oxidoreductase RutF
MAGSLFNFANQEIYVVTAAYAGQVSGQATTWITLASLIPEYPRVTAIISPRNYTFALIRKSSQFVLNLLAEGQQDWVTRFGLQSTRDVDKFVGIATQSSANGIPILPDTCGWAECTVIQTVDLGDRMVFIADVIQQQVHEHRKPLRRQEALAALPPEVTQALAAKRLLDIENERPLRLELGQSQPKPEQP